MNILEELWCGRICPVSQADYCTDDYQQMVRLYQRNEDKLLPTLNDTQKADYEKMCELVEGMRNIAECHAFINGFRLGVQLMSASLGELSK